uniref:U1-ctenitoxin-Pk1a n=1 Tax=Phoneutria keyserlingi TaxID=272754 RepID=TX21A_PHOKE|nr:RecName: Full=U1-ctenitoxin-Pk1a; Short=U1-CNTX-Pk1a; AltName: Full=Neurotoxin PKTx19C5 [Phoneutria keyserlingi]
GKCADAWKSCDNLPCCVVNGYSRTCMCSANRCNCEETKKLREHFG